MVTARIRLHRCWQARALRWTCVFGVLALVGCALPRRDAPPTLFSSATPVDFPADVRFLSTDRASVETKSTAALQRLRSSSKDGTVRALVLSGGGAGGAFGAGALVGLSRRQERPQYDVVTGVSAGALIAPFAFLGPEWDAQLTEAFTSGRGEQMSVSGLLELPFGTSRRSAALTALVDHYVTPDLINAVAREASSGRLLWVATTDLDKEETVIWDLGAIAMRGGEPARKLFRDVAGGIGEHSGCVRACTHPRPARGTGCTTKCMSMEAHPPRSLSRPWQPTLHYWISEALDGARVYVLINGQIIDAPETTPFKLGPIVARTFSVALKHMSRAQVVAVDQFADKYRMSVQSTYLPFDYPKYSSADFRASTMRPLFEYGARCAESGRLWTTMDETMATVAAAAPASKRTPPVDEEVACPLRDVQLAAGSTR